MKKFFNMIEVTLAIAVVGLGMAAIMALFPVGFQASRDAIGDNYAANAGEQFLAFIARRCDDPTIGNGTTPPDLLNGKDFWETYIVGSISDTIPTAADETDSFSPSPVEGNIFPHITNKQLYRIKAGVRLPDNTFKVTDFYGTARVWKSAVHVWSFNPSLPVSHPTNPGLQDVLDSEAARINCEISWPVEKPYNSREKRYYSVELFKQR